LKLYLMRHGPAEAQAASGLDGDRGLTASGRERVRAVAKALVESDEVPAHIATSPLVRAVQTAEIVALIARTARADGEIEAVEVRRELSPEGKAVPWIRTLAAQGRKRVMMVGHEPDMSSIASALLGGRFDQGFDKAMVVGLHLPADAQNAQLRFVLDPHAPKMRPFG
jgi:phosphohistidine phosphatase